jgi:hypothetical protein
MLCEMINGTGSNTCFQVVKVTLDVQLKTIDFLLRRFCIDIEQGSPGGTCLRDLVLGKTSTEDGVDGQKQGLGKDFRVPC